MMRSMFAGVSGLRTHQVRMDVIGNNIANVNTYGFKSSRASFQDMLSQTIRGASAPTNVRGGTNPQQVGLGVQLGSIDVLHSQGNTESTGNITDLAIEGDGFFVLGSGDQRLYTRAGMFGLSATDASGDQQGNLVSLVNGLRVQGFEFQRIPGTDQYRPVEAQAGNLKDIYINTEDTIPGRATDSVLLAGNLDARYDAEAGGLIVNRQFTALDSRGGRVDLRVELTQLDDSSWSYRVFQDAAEVFGPETLVFDENGSVESGSTANFIIDAADLGTGVAPLNIRLDLGQMTSYAQDTTVIVQNINGYRSGILESFTVDQAGVVTGSYSNGLTRPLWQIGMARFPNAAGLSQSGSTMFAESSNSGDAIFGAAGSGGFGEVAPSSLEMSNVDLSQEFTNMIVTQRGFQANSRIITSSDEMLQELVNLKR